MKKEITLTEEERELLTEILYNEVKNGNTVEPKPLEVTPKAYKTVCTIIKKLTAAGIVNK